MSIRTVVWSVTAILGAVWWARRALDERQWTALRQRYPYAKRPHLQPFPLLVYELLHKLVYQLLIGGILMSLWKLMMRVVQAVAAKCQSTHQPHHEDGLLEDTAAAQNDTSMDETDETDSLHVVVHTPPRQQPQRTAATKRHHQQLPSKLVLKPTVRFQEDGPSSVLRRRTNADQGSTPMKSVTFSEDASGAVSTTEHRYPKPTQDKENSSRLVFPKSRSIAILGSNHDTHPPGQRQIANALQRRRQELLTRKRPAESSTAIQPSEKRLSLAQFKSQRPVPPKRKSYRRELARFQHVKKCRVNVQKQVSFATDNKQVSFQVGSTQPAAAAPSEPVTARLVSTPQAATATESLQQPTPHPIKEEGFALSKQATPHPHKDSSTNPTQTPVRTTPEVQANTSGVATPVPFAKAMGTPHPNKKAVSFGESPAFGGSSNDTAGTATTAVTFGNAAPANQTPTFKSSQPNGKTVSFGEAPALAQTPTFSNSAPTNAPSFGAAAPQFSAPAPSFGTAAPQQPAPTNAPSFGTAAPNTPAQTGLPATFGTAPAPSFQFGSTAANTPKPGPVVNGSANVSFGAQASQGAMNMNGASTSGIAQSSTANVSAVNPFGHGTASNAPAFGSTNATSAFGTDASNGTTNSIGNSAPSASANPFGANTTQPGSNSFGTAAPTGANPFGGGSAQPQANAFGQTTAPSTSVTSFGGATAQPGGANPFGNNGASNSSAPNPFGGSAQANGANPFGQSTAAASSSSISSFGSSGQANGSNNPFANASAVAAPTFGSQTTKSVNTFGTGATQGATAMSFGGGASMGGFNVGSASTSRSSRQLRRSGKR